jgi:hypothetical protein
MLSILCHFHGLLFFPATLGFYSYIDQRNGPYSEGLFVVIVVDECFGDYAHVEITTDVKSVYRYLSRMRMYRLSGPRPHGCFGYGY